MSVPHRLPLAAILAPVIFFGLVASLYPQSGGANVGWAYYGLLKGAGAGAASGQWSDLKFSAVGGAAGQAPAKDQQLKCEQTISIRSGPVSMNGDGTLKWPPIIGVVAGGSVVRIVGTTTVAGSQGTQYWVQIVANQ
jgi:hypothetical protein